MIDLRVYAATSIVASLALACASSVAMAEQPEKGTSHKSAVHVKPKALGALEALQRLSQGNRRYIEGKSLHAHQDQSRRRELLPGQNPFAIILSCSDSRVPPEVIMDQGLGDIFVIRTAGQIPDTVGLASIEYAVEHLGTRLVVVLGHDSCGAVKAALTQPAGISTGSSNLDALIGTIKPGIRGMDSAKADPSLREPVRANVAAVSSMLTERSQIIREALERDEVVVVQAVYHLDSGKVDFWF